MTICGALLGVSLAILYYLLRSELPKIFTANDTDQQVIEGTIWIYLCFSAFILGLNGVLEGSISAMGRHKYQFFVMVLAIAVFITLGSICVYLNKDLEFLWLALLVYQVRAECLVSKRTRPAINYYNTLTLYHLLGHSIDSIVLADTLVSAK